jgi:hypothetical protein
MYQTATAVTGGSSPMPVQLTEPCDIGGLYVHPAVGRVFFVRGNGTTVTNYDDQYTQFTSDETRKLYPSVASVLAAGVCKANRGDVICALPGHTENISAADNWPFVAGLRIECIGEGTAIPTFTFTGTTTSAAQILMNDANVSIRGGRFLCAGPAGTTALTVTAPFVMSGAGCSLIGCQFEVGIDADQICTTFITISGANCVFARNRVETAAVGAAITDAVVIAAGAHNLVFEHNSIKAVLGAVGTGVVRTSGAATNIVIRDNFSHAWLANSTICINLGASASTGRITGNILRMEKADDITSALTVNAANDMTLSGNLVCNEKNKTTVSIGTAVDA